MSEYQYYEFAAIEGPISDEGLRYARGCSSRANVSRVRWQNTYIFGDANGKRTHCRSRKPATGALFIGNATRKADGDGRKGRASSTNSSGSAMNCCAVTTGPCFWDGWLISIRTSGGIPRTARLSCRRFHRDSIILAAL